MSTDPKCCECGKRADAVEHGWIYYCALCWMRIYKEKRNA